MKINSLLNKCFAFSIVIIFVGGTIFLGIAKNPQVTSDNEERRGEENTRSAVQLIITDDGSGDPTDKKVDVPAYIPNSGNTPMLDIYFSILGTASSGIRQYYGDDPWEDWKNITISGDILYLVNETTLHHIVNGDWITSLTPTKPYGKITLQIDWPGSDNGSANQTLDIINGTNVVSQIETYIFGEDTTLWVTVTDWDGVPVKNGELYLLWEENNSQFNSTIGNNKLGNGLNGEYRFIIQFEEQGYFPQHITIAAKIQISTGFWGYTKVDPVIAEPKLNLSLKGGLGVTIVMKNEGQFALYNVNTSIDFDTGIFLRPKSGHSSRLWDTVSPDFEIIWIVPVFGIGKTTLIVKALRDDVIISSIIKKALVLGPFIFIK